MYKIHAINNIFRLQINFRISTSRIDPNEIVSTFDCRLPVNISHYLYQEFARFFPLPFCFVLSLN